MSEWYISYAQTYNSDFWEDIERYSSDHFSERLIHCKDGTPFKRKLELRVGFLSGSFNSEHQKSEKKNARSVLLPFSLNKLQLKKRSNVQKEFNVANEKVEKMFSEKMKRKEVSDG